VLDLGCGTGNIAVPLAGRVRAVIGMDPEPDMLNYARASERANITWVIGTDRDVPALHAALGHGALDAVTIGSALHWMDRDRLFLDLRPVLHAGGSIAIIANGLPHWRHDLDWSRALREALQDWLGVTLSGACGTDEESQDRYAISLTEAGYDVHRLVIEYTETLTLDQIVGSMYSAMREQQLPPPERRPAFVEYLRRAIGDGPIEEPVPVTAVIGRKPDEPVVTAHT
jgi:SAM-dependent methyltransferase